MEKYAASIIGVVEKGVTIDDFFVWREGFEECIVQRSTPFDLI